MPFNDNLLRPCPMLENPEWLPKLVEASGAECTNLTVQESACELCSKCTTFAEEWKPVAERMWDDPADPRFKARKDPNIGMAKTDLTRFKALGRTIKRD